jgi:hypothetical protein
MTHKTDKPSGWLSLAEVPSHIGIAPSDHALRVLLGAAVDLPFVQWQIAPLDSVDRRLAGCVWQVVGCLVPLTDDHPDYPFLQWQHPPTRLQVWLWRVFQPPQKLCGELRWHPENGRSAAIVGLLPGDGRAEVLRAWQWLNTSKPFTGGRPLWTGAFRDRAHLEGLLIELIRQFDRRKPPISASRRNLARFLMYSHLKTRNIDVAEETLRENLRRTELDLNDVRRRAREPRP